MVRSHRGNLTNLGCGLTFRPSWETNLKQLYLDRNQLTEWVQFLCGIGQPYESGRICGLSYSQQLAGPIPSELAILI